MSGLLLQSKIISWNGCLKFCLSSSRSPVSLDQVKDKITCKFYEASLCEGEMLIHFFFSQNGFFTMRLNMVSSL